MMTLIELAKKAKEAKYQVALLSTEVKNKTILAVADALEANSKDIVSANATMAAKIKTESIAIVKRFLEICSEISS